MSPVDDNVGLFLLREARLLTGARLFDTAADVGGGFSGIEAGKLLKGNAGDVSTCRSMRSSRGPLMRPW